MVSDTFLLSCTPLMGSLCSGPDVLNKALKVRKCIINSPQECVRPYHGENTGSRQITAVKQRRAWLVLGWETAWEHHVL